MERYREVLLCVIERLLARDVRCRADLEDVLQEALADFFNDKRYEALENPEALKSFLCGMVEHKARDRSRFHHSQRRDCRRRRSLNSLAECPDFDLYDPGPAPEQPVEDSDWWEALLGAVGEAERQFIYLWLAGQTLQAIQEQLGCDLRKIRANIKRALERLCR